MVRETEVTPGRQDTVCLHRLPWTARVSQPPDLTLLASDIQERILRAVGCQEQRRVGFLRSAVRSSAWAYQRTELGKNAKLSPGAAINIRAVPPAARDSSGRLDVPLVRHRAYGLGP